MAKNYGLEVLEIDIPDRKGELVKLKQKYMNEIAKRVHPQSNMKSLRRLSTDSLKAIYQAFEEMDEKIKEAKQC